MHVDLQKGVFGKLGQLVKEIVSCKKYKCVLEGNMAGCVQDSCRVGFVIFPTSDFQTPSWHH